MSAFSLNWPSLRHDKLGKRATILKYELVNNILKLETTTEIAKVLKSRILDDVDKLSDARTIRLDTSLGAPPLYFYVVVFGFLVTMACFGAYQANAPVIGLVSLYTIFIGLVVYLIISLSDPFHGGLGVKPTTFEFILDEFKQGEKIIDA